MNNEIFIQTKDTFSLNRLTCLRTEWLYNDCKLCYDRCQDNAIKLDSEKINLDIAKCTLCYDCVGVCPTSSFSIEEFNIDKFILEYKKDSISEKIDIPNLSILNSFHLLSLLLRNDYNTLKLNISTDTTQSNLAYISNIVDTTNKFTNLVNLDKKVSIIDEISEEKPRREALKKLFKNINDLGENKIHLNQENKHTPNYLSIFKNSLKLNIKDFKKTYFEDNSSLISNKKIDYQTCTNCQECITFCPTKALEVGFSKDNIMFTIGNCISCDICIDICKSNSIKNDNEFDLVNFAFDKSSELVKFNYHTCIECKTSFIYKGGKEICDRCIDYSENFQDMFTLAKDKKK